MGLTTSTRRTRLAARRRLAARCRGGVGSHTCLTPVRTPDHHRTYEVVPVVLRRDRPGRGAGIEQLRAAKAVLPNASSGLQLLRHRRLGDGRPGRTGSGTVRRRVGHHLPERPARLRAVAVRALAGALLEVAAHPRFARERRELRTATTRLAVGYN